MQYDDVEKFLNIFKLNNPKAWEERVLKYNDKYAKMLDFFTFFNKEEIASLIMRSWGNDSIENEDKELYAKRVQRLMFKIDEDVIFRNDIEKIDYKRKQDSSVVNRDFPSKDKIFDALDKVQKRGNIR